jgi:hypothetical protein
VFDVVVAAGDEEPPPPPPPRDSKPNSCSGAELFREEVEPEVVRCRLDFCARRVGDGVTLATAMVRGLVAGADVGRWVVVRRCGRDPCLVAGRSDFTIGGSGSSAVATQ